jgi:osmoprotectant transport system permease protein
VLGQIVQVITDPHGNFRAETIRTLYLSFVPIVLAIAISIPLGALVAQHRIAAFLAANISGLVRAIPIIAFLIFVAPFLHTGVLPTVVALVLIGIPPILLNTIAGLRGVDPAAVEAARGMGMTPWQVLSRIRIPLVLPVIAAGVRTAAVQIVATVPIAFLSGGGGYGDYIEEAFSGVQTATLFVGAGGIAILALIVELGLAVVQRAVTPAGLRVGEQPAAAGADETGGGQPAPAGRPAAA